MKRYNNLYEKIYSMDNLKLAHRNASKGKGWYEEVRAVDNNEDYYLKKLQCQLIDKSYKTSQYEIFKKNDNGKSRTIYKLPYYPDRICQWAIIQVIEPILIKKFTKDTYSAIPKRGSHLIIKQLNGCYKKTKSGDLKYEKSVFEKDTQGTKYCLKIDVKKYYPSINHDILKQKYKNTFKDKDLNWLISEIIDSISTCEFEDYEYSEKTGIPIGNYLSQYSGNLYLSDFDHWMKEVKKVKHYFRYMDDIVVLSGDKKELSSLFYDIQTYFNSKLKLTIKCNYQIFPTLKRGLDFVGYRFFGKFCLLRKTTCKRFKIKMRFILKSAIKSTVIIHSQWCSINSYKGILKWCDSIKLYDKYMKPLDLYCDKFYKTNILNTAIS